MKIEIGVNFDNEKVSQLDIKKCWKDNLNIVKDIEISFKIQKEDLVLLPLIGHLSSGEKIDKLKNIFQKAFEQAKDELNQAPKNITKKEKEKLEKVFKKVKLSPPNNGVE